MDPMIYFYILVGLPLVASPIVYLTGRLSIRRGGVLGISLARALTIFFLLVEMGLLALVLQSAIQTGSVYMAVGEVTLLFDGIGFLMAAVVLVLGLMVALFSVPYMTDERNEEKFFALLLITIGSIIGLVMSFDLFNLWVWFEVMAISTYFLVAFYNEQSASLEAGVKYLVQSAVGSALVLFGIAILFAQTGTTDMQSIWMLTPETGKLSALGGMLLIVGFGVKTAIVPLHTWLPDAHSQAPSGISAMLSGIVIEAGMVAMLRSLSLMGKITVPWGAVLLGFGCLNILVGNLMALRQKQVKRLLAYSSVAQVGYMLLGFGFSLQFSLMDGASGGFFHLITHAMMKGLAFLAAGALLYALYLSKGEHSPLMIDDLNGASRKYPLVAFALSAAVLGLGGLPPFAGFMSKWQILAAGVETQNTLMIIIVIFAGLNSVLSLAYYAPIVNHMYRREVSSAVEAGNRIPWLMVVPLVIFTLAIVIVGVWPSSMIFITQNAGYSLLYTFFN
ncbi:MAG TPA: proton-conducting transporter membrane subunit [Anaerolineaceae bacterium]|nr:proton-conducting transporter membrane subunit [Anaerolineaceae bacterium]